MCGRIPLGCDFCVAPARRHTSFLPVGRVRRSSPTAENSGNRRSHGVLPASVPSIFHRRDRPPLRDVGLTRIARPAPRMSGRAVVAPRSRRRCHVTAVSEPRRWTPTTRPHSQRAGSQQHPPQQQWRKLGAPRAVGAARASRAQREQAAPRAARAWLAARADAAHREAAVAEHALTVASRANRSRLQRGS
jgi:hypothetical protein